MIRVKYEEIMNQGFMEAISKLSQIPMPNKKSYTLAKLVEALESVRKKIRKEYEDTVIKAFAQMENGRPIPAPRTPGPRGSNPPFVLIDGKTAEEYEKADQAFRDQEANILRQPLTIEWLEEVSPNTSAADLTFLFPILLDPHKLEETPAPGPAPAQTGPRAVG